MNKKYKHIIVIIITLIAGYLIGTIVEGNYVSYFLQRFGIINTRSERNFAAEAWTNCLEKSNYKVDIVFFGDSLTCYSDFQRYFGNEYSIANLGCVGDTLTDMEQRIDTLKAVSPSKIFILGGINGLNKFTVNKEIEEYDRLLTKIKLEVPDATLYVQSVLPISKPYINKVRNNDVVIEFNKKLLELCNSYDIEYIDIFSLYYVDGNLDFTVTEDGLHLKDFNSYERWAEYIQEYIKE